MKDSADIIGVALFLGVLACVTALYLQRPEVGKVLFRRRMRTPYRFFLVAAFTVSLVVALLGLCLAVWPTELTLHAGTPRVEFAAIVVMACAIAGVMWLAWRNGDLFVTEEGIHAYSSCWRWSEMAELREDGPMLYVRTRDPVEPGRRGPTRGLFWTVWEIATEELDELFFETYRRLSSTRPEAT